MLLLNDPYLCSAKFYCTLSCVYVYICLFIIYLFIVIMLNPAIKKSFKMNVGFTDSLYSINDNN